MMTRLSRLLTAGGLGAAAVVAPVAAAPGTTAMGPSTTTAPYILPAADDVHITSLLTVDDAGSASNGYEMVGIPDGLGARMVGRNTLLINMTHELVAAAGIERRHGQTGSFVSGLRLVPATNEVRAGKDFIAPRPMYWNYLTSSYAAAPNAAGAQPDGDVFPAYDARFARFCSASLTPAGGLYNPVTRRGYRGQLFFANEESGNEGRVFAVEPRGKAWQLPRLGLFSWENTIAAPNTSDTTLVMGMEDAGVGEIWVYVGTKQASGKPIERAGLSNGVNYVVDLVNESVSTDAGFRGTYGKGVPAPFDLAVVDWDQSGADQNAVAPAVGLPFNRTEDGAFDPRNPNDFYFVTTAGGAGTGGGVWRLRWTNIEQPLLGGTLTLLLDGSEGLFNPDNVDVDTHGNLLIQEDPGNNAHVARIMAYRIADGALGTVARFDTSLFVTGAPNFITQDEESSGIIDAEEFFGIPGTFLFDAQVHAAPVNNAVEYVERGQLLRLQVDDWDSVYGGAE
jgi:Bacterial protein of unknown function (DUF839)